MNLWKTSNKNIIGYVVVLIPFVTFLLGLMIGYKQAQHDYGINANQNIALPIVREAGPTNEKNIDLSLFWKVWNTLDEIYIDTSKMDSQRMVYGAIKGMVASLNDPYTIFMTPKETEDFRNSLSGDLEGIGAELSIKEGHLIIVSPLKDSPADKAGLKPGDIIYKINDALTTNMSLTEAVSRIRGPRGTIVKLVILRERGDRPIELAIERKEIKIPSVSLEMKDKNIAYISINQFGDETTKEFGSIVNETILKKPRGIILDLRYNGGGYLDGAVDIVSEFIEDGVVTTIKKRNDNNNKDVEEIQKVKGNARLSKLPLVVLINEGSASAAEIVAGAIQDYKRGTLVGSKSFGKGTVQELEPLSDGSSLRITIAKWLTPTNGSIDEMGITPDIVVPISDDDEKNNIDPQMNKALQILEEQLQLYP